MESSLYQCKNYKEFLRNQMEKYRLLRGYQGQMAAAIRCQPSFFSRVLNSDSHLTRDQAAELCRFWRLGNEATEYFIGLVDLERAGSEYLKSRIRARLSDLQQKSSDITLAVQKMSISKAEAQMQYYSSWYWSAIHIATSVVDLQEPAKIARRFGLNLQLVEEILTTLAQMGLVVKQGEKWKISETDIHLSNRSPMNEVNHSNWRQRAILNIQARHLDSIHYSSVFAISRVDAELIRSQIFEALKKARETIGPSKEEELYCLNCDFFKV
jgi:uncharacterized protein (TIGR02147 family)